MPKQEKEVLDQEVRRTAQNALIGEEKKGDLTGVFVHKFKIKTTQYLLAYRKVGQDLELVMIDELVKSLKMDLMQFLV